MATLATQPGFSPGIMSDLEWDEGIQVPVANEENKALEQEVGLFIKLVKEFKLSNTFFCSS